MDKNVIAAMARWPDVPDVFGWLSLTVRGQWRLHPAGDALSPPSADELGEPIGSPQIIQFINRNYAGDSHGRWYFQNGPQRVFVRLDAAPYILHTTAPTPALQLRAHNGLDVETITGWWLDQDGRLYAKTEHGPGLIDGRDTAVILESLRTKSGEPLLDVLERDPRPAQELVLRGTPDVALGFFDVQAAPEVLGFVACPCGPGTLGRIAV